MIRPVMMLLWHYSDVMGLFIHSIWSAFIVDDDRRYDVTVLLLTCGIPFTFADHFVVVDTGDDCCCCWWWPNVVVDDLYVIDIGIDIQWHYSIDDIIVIVDDIDRNDPVVTILLSIHCYSVFSDWPLTIDWLMRLLINRCYCYCYSIHSLLLCWYWHCCWGHWPRPIDIDRVTGDVTTLTSLSVLPPTFWSHRRHSDSQAVDLGILLEIRPLKDIHWPIQAMIDSDIHCFSIPPRYVAVGIRWLIVVVPIRFIRRYRYWRWRSCPHSMTSISVPSPIDHSHFEPVVRFLRAWYGDDTLDKFHPFGDIDRLTPIHSDPNDTLSIDRPLIYSVSPVEPVPVPVFGKSIKPIWPGILMTTIRNHPSIDHSIVIVMEIPDTSDDTVFDDWPRWYSIRPVFPFGVVVTFCSDGTRSMNMTHSIRRWPNDQSHDGGNPFVFGDDELLMTHWWSVTRYCQKPVTRYSFRDDYSWWYWYVDSGKYWLTPDGHCQYSIVISTKFGSDDYIHSRKASIPMPPVLTFRKASSEHCGIVDLIDLGFSVFHWPRSIYGQFDIHPGDDSFDWSSPLTPKTCQYSFCSWFN